MFYLLDVEDHVRVEPKHFGLPTKEAIEKQLNEDFVDSVSKEFGYVVAVLEIGKIDDGVIISGDGAAYYNSHFKDEKNKYKYQFLFLPVTRYIDGTFFL